MKYLKTYMKDYLLYFTISEKKPQYKPIILKYLSQGFVIGMCKLTVNPYINYKN